MTQVNASFISSFPSERGGDVPQTLEYPDTFHFTGNGWDVVARRLFVCGLKRNARQPKYSFNKHKKATDEFLERTPSRRQSRRTQCVHRRDWRISAKSSLFSGTGTAVTGRCAAGCWSPSWPRTPGRPFTNWNWIFPWLPASSWPDSPPGWDSRILTSDLCHK